MGLFARFWHYSIDTYGGAPMLLLINLIQVAVAGLGDLAGLARPRRDRPVRRPPHPRRAPRGDSGKKQVRPIALTMMLLGPGLGLGMSTLLGALGMGALGDAMGTGVGADALAATMARAYREISYAYFLMVGGTSRCCSDR